MNNLTDDELGGNLKQLADNMWDVKTWCSEELNDLSATATHAVISFPFKIKVLGIRTECVGTATTGFAINLTDGTNALTSTVASSSTYQYDKVDQSYDADTRLSVQSDAVAAVTAATARFMFHYVIDERKNI